MIVLADEEHRRQRRKADFRAGSTRKQRDARVEYRFLAGVQIELVGACRSLAVEQRVDRRAVGIRPRCLDPEFAEERKFLVGSAGVDRKSARRHAIALAPAEKAEIARAQERDRLVEYP